MKRKNKVLFIVFTVIFIAAVAIGIYYQLSQKAREDVYKNLAQERKTTATPSATPSQAEETPTPTLAEVVTPVEIPIDFDALQQRNPDVYAWIQIPGTVVDYPILQSGTDNLYYLDHTIDGEAGLPGSIYTENSNSQDFSDKNTVIYGHNMKDKSMFGALHYYENSTYMQENPLIYIYTKEHKLTYQIFGAVTYDSRHILHSFDFNDDSQYQEFLNSLHGVRNMNTYINKEIPVTTADRILTLSTCNGNDDQRFLIEAVLISEE